MSSPTSVVGHLVADTTAVLEIQIQITMCVKGIIIDSTSLKNITEQVDEALPIRLVGKELFLLGFERHASHKVNFGCYYTSRSSQMGLVFCRWNSTVAVENYHRTTVLFSGCNRRTGCLQKMQHAKTGILSLRY